MKLIAQSDDYGITKAASQGILEAIRFGIIKNTGMFANMPWIEECVEWIRPYIKDIAFGIDLNASTGPSLLGKEKVPHLVDDDGNFLSSRTNRSLDTSENNFDHLAAIEDELYLEFKAQIDRYIDLVQQKPVYIHNHAYGTKTTTKVTERLSQEYGVPTTTQFMKDPRICGMDMGWYAAKDPLEQDAYSYITTHYPLDKPDTTTLIICHCGYVDATLMKLSSFNLCRMKDLEAFTSKRLKDWLLSHDIQPISYKEI